jgi:hypothetical protein
MKMRLNGEIVEMLSVAVLQDGGPHIEDGEVGGTAGTIKNRRSQDGIEVISGKEEKKDQQEPSPPAFA